MNEHQYQPQNNDVETLSPTERNRAFHFVEYFHIDEKS